MKKLISFFLLLIMAVSACTPFAAAETTIEPDMKLTVSKPSFTANNPIIDGEDPVTGLPTGRCGNRLSALGCGIRQCNLPGAEPGHGQQQAAGIVYYRIP